MSLLLATFAALGGLTAAGLAWRGWRGRRRKNDAAGAVPAASRLAAAGFELELGDVVSSGGSEAWIEHGWILCEGDETVAAVLRASEVTLVVTPPPGSRVFWLQAIDIDHPDDPPATVAHDGARYERASRVPVRVEALGTSPDPPWRSAILAEYRALDGATIWTLGAAGLVSAWAGRRVDPGDFERWGGGSATLEQ